MGKTRAPGLRAAADGRQCRRHRRADIHADHQGGSLGQGDGPRIQRHQSRRHARAGGLRNQRDQNADAHKLQAAEERVAGKIRRRQFAFKPGHALLHGVDTEEQ